MDRAETWASIFQKASTVADLQDAIGHANQLEGREVTARYLAGALLDQPLGLMLADLFATIDQHRPTTQRHAATPQRVIYAVACEFGVSIGVLTSATRTARLVMIRSVAAYLMRRCCEMPVVAIGEALGGRDHSTILHSITQLKARMQKDHELERTIVRLMERFAP